MPDKDKLKTRQNRGKLQPVVFVHASGISAASEDWLKDLQAGGFHIFSHARLPGCKQTRSSYTDLGALLKEIGAAAPGQALLIIRAGLQLKERECQAIQALLESSDSPVVLTALSNADADLNPFAGLSSPTLDDPGGRHGDLVALLGIGEIHGHYRWPGHFAAFSPAAISALAEDSTRPENALTRLHAQGGKLQLADWIYFHDPFQSPWSAPKLEPHESMRPAAWGQLSERLAAWLAADPGRLPARITPDAPATLHITHSWGGGVAQWIRSFIDGDPGGHHLQLRSEGPRSGEGHGQRLALYAGNHLECPIANWWLQPPIQSVDIENTQYLEVLTRICTRYGVGRVFVSSLVGHSLDAFRSGLPSIHVMHDHFPAWPLLSIHPSEYGADLGRAMADPRARAEFKHGSERTWRRIHDAYLEALQSHTVVLVAPSPSVIAVQRTLDPRWENFTIELIEHGFPPLVNPAPVAARPRRDGRLRLLIPGRVQPGKGKALLKQALPELARHAQVYLLGTGKQGEDFFGQASVDVVTDYKRENLPRILETIGPHVAALLSVVPETFSYTLSEMRALGVPTIATRLGSFEERVRDGETGWLIDPTPEALISKVAHLGAHPDEIEGIRNSLEGYQPRSIQDMVSDYDALCPPATPPGAFEPVEQLSLDQAQSASSSHIALTHAAALRAASAEQDTLRQEIRKRTDWALDVSRALKEEEEQRIKWVDSLNAELEQSYAQLHDSIAKLDERTARLQDTSQELSRTQSVLNEARIGLDQLRAEFERLAEVHETVLNSSSWRITRPLRVLRRMAGNFMQSRAWNPLRWPLLLSQLARNLSTVGIRGTLMRMQYSAQGSALAPETSPVGNLQPLLEVCLPDAMPSPQKPAVSIVVPAYNQLLHTSACLKSIAQAKCQAEFEVIVVDDNSSDQTAELLPGVVGLTYLRNPENLGFIKSSNRGAAKARGEFLVMLNNDTQVQDGWLDELLAVFERHDDAGIVGARLLYPDGSLQECGGMVFRDGSGWNYGRGDDPDRPEYLYLRKVDYCSGACIMMRTGLFRELGGFDEHYAPAYYEDTDLAFRVRERGLNVYVQPAATVIHHEGATSGTKLESGTKRFQAVNREKFLARWSGALQNQPERIEDPTKAALIRQARDHRLLGRVLVIDAYTPEPDQDSGSMRLTHLMRCFRELGFGVTFFADNRGHAGRYTTDLQLQGIEVYYQPWLHSLHSWFREHGPEFNYVVISRHYVAVNYLSVLKKYCPRARFIFDTVDLHYLREQRLADLENSLALARVARQTRRSELAIIEAADATLVVSTVEQEVLASDAPGEVVHVLSNIHPVNPRKAGFAERKDLFFVGGYQHPPNIDAATWFVNRIWPLIHAEIPDATFHLIGSKAPEKVRKLKADGMVFHGFVEDLGYFLDNCRLAVAPLRYGAGVKGKVNLSMSHGQPVVATPVATEGMFAEHERDILVAGDEQGFASEVVRIYQDEALWKRVSDGAIRNVEEHFSVAAAKRSLEKLLERLND